MAVDVLEAEGDLSVRRGSRVRLLQILQPYRPRLRSLRQDTGGNCSEKIRGTGSVLPTSIFSRYSPGPMNSVGDGGLVRSFSSTTL